MDGLTKVLNNSPVNKETGCWEWQLGTNGSRVKYGRAHLDDRQQYAHRYVYEQTYGPLVASMYVDHLCKNPLCCNPFHLEAVTQLVNNQRQRSANREKTVCHRGHDLTQPNSYYFLRPQKEKWSPRRQCTACNTRRGRNYRQSNRGGEPF